MSLVTMFYFTSSMLNMFRTLIHPSSGACEFSIESPHWSCVLVSMCVGVSVWLGWSGTIEKSQAPDDGCINVRNMLSIEEVKQNLITSDIKLVSYSSTDTKMHGPIYVRFMWHLFYFFKLLSFVMSRVFVNSAYR